MIRRAMTLLELMLVLAVLAVVAALVMPMAVHGDSVTVDATARLLSSDLEHAQMLALSRPDHRIALAVDEDGRGWKIVDADAPGVALVDTIDASHQGRMLSVRCGEGRAALALDVSVGPTGSMIIFDPLGGLETLGGPAKQLSVEIRDSSRSVSIDPDTGFVNLD
jgi:prepilin-type N-terminal cleavage/methylation domain-containing protein